MTINQTQQTMKLKSLLLAALAFAGISMDIHAQDNGQAGRILVAYFSWGGNTRHVAEYIARQTGGTLFRIEPEKPYPSEYVPCTEVAKAEKEQNARPAIREMAIRKNTPKPQVASPKTTVHFSLIGEYW